MLDFQNLHMYNKKIYEKFEEFFSKPNSEPNSQRWQNKSKLNFAKEFNLNYNRNLTLKRETYPPFVSM